MGIARRPNGECKASGRMDWGEYDFTYRELFTLLPKPYHDRHWTNVANLERPQPPQQRRPEANRPIGQQRATEHAWNHSVLAGGRGVCHRTAGGLGMIGWILRMIFGRFTS